MSTATIRTEVHLCVRGTFDIEFMMAPLSSMYVHHTVHVISAAISR